MDKARSPTRRRRAAAGLLAIALGGCASAAARPSPEPVGARSGPAARTAAGGAGWRPVATVRGAPAAWVSTRDGVTLLRFDQRLVRLALHSGSIDAGPGFSRYGAAIVGPEQRRVVAAFNGGFRLNSHSGGWLGNGRTAVPLTRGLASIVTYHDGMTDIGAWQVGVPSGQPISSVRQNLHLLVDGGRAAANVNGCVKCWGATLGSRLAVARSGIGITASNMLIWAGVSSALPATLARALIDGGAVRAAELDINPAWVAGYLYHQGGGGAVGIPVVPGQVGVPGRFLTPYSRDFFSIIRR